MKNTILTFLLFHFVLISQAQEMVYGIVPCGQSIRHEQVSDAKVISDINPRFPASWIKEYVSVDLSVISHGQILTTSGVGFELNKEQQDILKLADTGSDIKVTIKYFPNNTLPKEIKEMNFRFKIVPDIDASFPGERLTLQNYLKEKIINHLPEISEREVHQAKVSFEIGRNGEVANVKTLERSHSAEVDALLLSTISQMSDWTPARNADGTIQSQSFELIVTRDQCTYSYLTDDE